jgi:FkbM family methyltransferase
MAKLKEIAHDLCPPILWGMAKRIRYQYSVKPVIKPVWKIVHGVKMLLPSSHALPSIVTSFPYYDTSLPEFLQFLRGERGTKLLIVDVGANVGDTAALIAAKVGAENVRFICLEADEQYLPFLKANTENMDAEIICAIIGSSSKEVHVDIQRSQTGTGAVVEGSRAATVLALDDILSDQTPDLIKVDTDGYDIQVVRGAARCLQNDGPHLFLEYSPYSLRVHGKAEPTSLFPFLRNMGYGATIIYDHIGYPICLLDLDSRQLIMIAEYVDAKPEFYANLLVSKDRDLLTRFYESDRKRFIESGPRSLPLG